MALTRGSRFGLWRWGAGADPFTRQQMEDSHAAIENLGAIDQQGTMAQRPATGVRGRYYYVEEPDTPNHGALFRDTGVAWVQINRRAMPTRIPHTFTINGDVFIPSGDTFYVPPFFVPVPPGQTVSLIGARYVIRSGTEVIFDIRENGVAIHSSLTGLRATTTPTTATSAAPTQALSNGTALSIVVTGVTGSPKSLSVSLYLDYLA